MFIYASHAQGDQPLNSLITWRGLYTGYVSSRRGRYPGQSSARPQSTASDRPVWAGFWEVQALEQLSLPFPISKLQGKNKKTTYQSRFVPEGPVLIEYPQIQ